ncbi:MAG: hypothetical protein CSB55_02340 [Candidatus Cloacimonadota bacterium]|nr:MAG: hypothetical protein CSB55_02340 [Candidatus Cloacimonadota bacterium]
MKYFFCLFFCALAINVFGFNSEKDAEILIADEIFSKVKEYDNVYLEYFGNTPSRKIDSLLKKKLHENGNTVYNLPDSAKIRISLTLNDKITDSKNTGFFNKKIKNTKVYEITVQQSSLVSGKLNYIETFTLASEFIENNDDGSILETVMVSVVIGSFIYLLYYGNH